MCHVTPPEPVPGQSRCHVTRLGPCEPEPESLPGRVPARHPGSRCQPEHWHWHTLRAESEPARAGELEINQELQAECGTCRWLGLRVPPRSRDTQQTRAARHLRVGETTRRNTQQLPQFGARHLAAEGDELVGALLIHLPCLKPRPFAVRNRTLSR
eukprot:1819579-Rhodomonas_salina.1